MTFGSLFSGIGGIDLGLTRAGMECRWMVEIEPFNRKVLAKQFSGVPCYEDIRKLNGPELERVDLICGGFPCQDLSQAGKRTGLTDSDGAPTRSGLWFEFARIVGILRPRWILAENVPGLLVPGAIGRVVGDLARLGYVGCWQCLRASDFGASHLRKRVFIVAYNPQLIGRREQIGLRGSALPAGVSATLSELGYGNESREDSHTKAGISRSAIGEPSEQLAHRPPGGRGELRQPSGSGGQSDGSGEGVRHLEDSRHAGAGRAEEPSGQHRRGASGDDSGASGALADPSRDGERGQDGEEGRSGRGGVCAPSEQLADPCDGLIQEPRRRAQGRDGFGPTGADVPDSISERCDQGSISVPDEKDEGGAGQTTFGSIAEIPPFAPGPSDPRWPAILRDRPDLAPALGGRLNPRFVCFLMGFPIGFTEVEDANADEVRSRAVLRGLRIQNVSQKNQRTDGRPDGVPEAGILRSEVHGEGINEGESYTDGVAQASCSAQKAELRTVWNRREIGDSSQGPKLEEQRTLQPTDIMQQLSHFVASCERRDRPESERAALSILQSPDLEAVCVQYLSDPDKARWNSAPRDDKTAILIESGKATRAMSNRTKRLKALGNAVVPQCAQYIGERIMEIEAQ